MWGYPPPSLDSILETTSYGFQWHVNRALLACETYQILSAFLPAASLAWNCLFTLLVTSGFCKNVICSEKLSPLAPSKVDALLIATLQSFVMAPFVSFLLSTTMNNYLFICWFVPCMSLPLNCRLSESRNPVSQAHRFGCTNEQWAKGRDPPLKELLCFRGWANTSFTSSFSCPTSIVRWLLLLSFYRRGNWVSKRSRLMPEVTHWPRRRATFRTWTFSHLFSTTAASLLRQGCLGLSPNPPPFLLVFVKFTGIAHLKFQECGIQPKQWTGKEYFIPSFSKCWAGV